MRQRLKYFIQVKIAFFLSKNGFLSSLYYTFLSKSFYREHKAVLNGKAKNLSESLTRNENYYQLVRNIHRIEKGLIMKPRKPTFALDYIFKTVENYSVIIKNSSFELDPQLKWFSDVLEEYFRSSEKTDYLNNLYDKFKLLNPFDQNFTEKFVPFSREIRSKISWDEFYVLAKQRRSVRWFTKEKVPRELIDKALLVANQSPSACNRQPIKFIIIDDNNILREISKFPNGTKGWSENIPMFIVVVGNLDAYFDERDRHVIYIDASLAAMSFMFALETLGLSSCPINWPDIESNEKKMDKILSLEKFQRPIMCLAVGYPDETGKVPFSQKVMINKLRKYY